MTHTQPTSSRRSLTHRLARALTVGASVTALVASALLGTAGAADAVTASPDPVFVLQGADIGSTSCDYRSTGTANHALMKAFSAKYPTTPVIPVRYFICDYKTDANGNYLYDNGSLISAGSGTDIINAAASRLSAAIKANTANDQVKVDVVAESLGTIISRQCLLKYAQNPNDPAYTGCKQIDDWIGLIPPSHGSYATTMPAITEASCSTWGSLCKRLSSGPHLQTSNACGIILVTAQKVCNSLNPNAEYQKSIAPGSSTSILVNNDETPGSTTYTAVYSYADEFVFTPQTTAVGAYHPSTLSGAINVVVPNETHWSVANLETFSTPAPAHLGRVRIALKTQWPNPLALGVVVEEYKPLVNGAAAPFCTDEVAAGGVSLLDDTNTIGPGAPFTLACT
ncbi:hypothetical protein ACIB24_08315 [Spongisporangium articulatum]|uniref:Uncharacterized protein n=1 Tax=Spongisporangium articulatum TaxID=3362603 RepID=A0ABW8AM61_9ACTN